MYVSKERPLGECLRGMPEANASRGHMAVRGSGGRGQLRCEGIRLKSEKLFEDSRIESKTLLRDDLNFMSVGVIRIDE